MILQHVCLISTCVLKTGYCRLPLGDQNSVLLSSDGFNVVFGKTDQQRDTTYRDFILWAAITQSAIIAFSKWTGSVCLSL